MSIIPAIFRRSKPRQSLPDLITARWYARQDPVRLPMSMKGKKKFIFFPWQGAFHWIMLTVLTAFCLNYNNNLGIAGVGMLGVFYLASLFQNYWSMNKIVLNKIKLDVTEKDIPSSMLCFFSHSRKSALDPPVCWIEVDQIVQRLEFDENKQAQVRLHFQVSDYGVYRLPRVRISTRWPHAITQTWIDIKLPQLAVVVPAPRTGLTDGHAPSLHERTLSVAHGSRGDIDGIRTVLSQESPSKIAWKSTLRHGKLMTYTWETPQAHSMVIRWPEGSQDDREKIQFVRDQIEEAIRLKMSFHIVHPQFSSKTGKGEHFGRNILGQLMVKILEPTMWPQSGRWQE